MTASATGRHAMPSSVHKMNVDDLLNHRTRSGDRHTSGAIFTAISSTWPAYAPPQYGSTRSHGSAGIDSQNASLPVMSSRTALVTFGRGCLIPGGVALAARIGAVSPRSRARRCSVAATDASFLPQVLPVQLRVGPGDRQPRRQDRAAVGAGRARILRHRLGVPAAVLPPPLHGALVCRPVFRVLAEDLPALVAHPNAAH